MSGVTIDLSDVAAFLALAVAIWSAVQTGRFNRRQTEFSHTAQRLNELLIAREAADDAEKRQADVSANFVKIGRNDYRFKVYNRGPGTARNVRVTFSQGEEVLAGDELEEKFPLPMLEQQHHVDLLCFIHMQSPRRAELTLHWDDESSTERQKELVLDIF
ncbi:hypothetical protein [Sphingopyxis sp. NJF-3]